MCGIVGVVAREGLPAGYPVEEMCDRLAHRGPDDRGTWVSRDRRVALGHRRLAVIDPSPAGRQPMVSASGRARIAFNGEIYNFREIRAALEARGARFASATDTEVILAGYETWGDRILERLEGMFAFAIVDCDRRRVLLARDRIGEKPLFIGRAAGRVLFGSELKALLLDPAAPRTIDREALAFYLAYGYVPGPRCLFRGFEKLPPATALAIDIETGDERRWCYWTLPPPPAPAADAGREAPALTDALEACLSAAVRRQLVADVPVGVLLSGGLDSSLVAALAARALPRVRTFTVTFPGHAAHDEGPHARLVARHLGTDHAELEASALSPDLLPAIVRQVDEPIADSAVVPTWLLARLVRRHAVVALGGDGCDELFGGYPHYQWLMRLARVRQVCPASVRALVAHAAARLPPGVRGRHHLMGLAGDVGQSLAHVNMYLDRRTRGEVAPAAAAGGDLPERWRASLGGATGDVRDRAMRADLASTLVDGYLVRVDRAGMHCALEVRAPFLDVPVVEFAAAVPAALKVTRTARKVLPARLAARLLPPGFDRARKQGFTMPLGAWFGRGWGAAMADLLHGDRELLDAAAVDRLLAGQRAGRANMERLFSLAMLALWRREHRVSL
jgi:asparagine synthase (glutamine-hydrolysing)